MHLYLQDGRAYVGRRTPVSVVRSWSARPRHEAHLQSGFPFEALDDDRAAERLRCGRRKLLEHVDEYDGLLRARRPVQLIRAACGQIVVEDEVLAPLAGHRPRGLSVQGRRGRAREPVPGEVVEFSAPDKRRPALVVQADLVNRSNIQTVIMAAVTSNILLADVRGNARLRKREGQLDKASVVNVSQPVTCDKHELLEKIGALTAERMAQVRAGLALVLCDGAVAAQPLFTIDGWSPIVRGPA
jgi:mRNA interferase MazF